MGKNPAIVNFDAPTPAPDAKPATFKAELDAADREAAENRLFRPSGKTEADEGVASSSQGWQPAAGNARL